jgi:crossover junction endodeoxyribonuclease RusA
MLMLPYPPSTNRYWRNFRGQMRRSPEAVAYKDVVQILAIDAGFQPRVGCVAVDMLLHPALPKDWEKRQKKDRDWLLSVRRLDLDNAMKVALDALQGIAFENDRQVTRLSIALGHAVVDGGLSVKINSDQISGRL